MGFRNFLFRYGFSLFPAAQFLMAYIASKTVARAIYMYYPSLAFKCESGADSPAISASPLMKAAEMHSLHPPKVALPSLRHLADC